MFPSMTEIGMECTHKIRRWHINNRYSYLNSVFYLQLMNIEGKMMNTKWQTY